MKKLIFIPILVLMLMSCAKPDKESAFIASKYWVEKQVPAQYGEVTFPFMDFRSDDIKNGAYIIESYLTCDAGKITYRAKMQYRGHGDVADYHNWKIESLTFE